MHIPINKINILHTGCTTIRATVVKSHEFKTYSGKSGMSLKIQDLQESEIHVIFWDDQFHKYKNFFKIGDCFEFSRFKVQRVFNQKYNETLHQFEIIAQSKTIITKVQPFFMVTTEDKILTCVKTNIRKRKQKRKRTELKQFYGIQTTQNTLNKYWQPKKKKPKCRKMITNQTKKKTQLSHQTTLDNFFKNEDSLKN